MMERQGGTGKQPSVVSVEVHVLGVGGRICLLLAFVIRRLTTHPFLDGVPFLLAREAPTHVGPASRTCHETP